MSRNGSYAKSMNGIVSFDDGDGTVIDGDGITTSIINCTTLNASSTVNTPTINTDFIGKKANSYITVLNNTTFNGDINVDNINTNTGTISLKNNTSITGTLALTSNIQTAYLEGRGIGGVGSPLNIGQSNDLTSYVNIGRDAITAGGFVFPAIPVRTTYIPTSNYDIVNKLYVDNATAGTNILSLSNTFTGTSNTFNNKIIVSNITYDTNTLSASPTTNAIDLFKTTTGDITIGSSGKINLTNNFSFSGLVMSGTDSNGQYNIMSDVTTGIVRFGHSITTGIIAIGQAMTTGTVNFVSPVSGTSSAIMNIGNSMSSSGSVNICSSSSAAGNVNIGYSGTVNLCNSLYVKPSSIDCNSNATINLFNSLTTGTLHVGKNIVGGSGILNLCNSIFITPNSIASGQTSDVSLFNSIGGTIGKIRMATNLIISEGAIDCTSVTDSIKLFFKLTTGTLSIGESMTNTGNLIIGGVSSVVKIFKAFQFFANTVLNSDDIQYIGTKNKIELLNTLAPTITLNFGGLSTINVGSVSATPGTVNINGKINNRPSSTIASIRLFGYTSYVMHNGATGNYTITDANVNIDLYIVTIGSVDCSVLLNANIPGQRVYIRNAMGTGRLNNVISLTSNIYRASGGFTNIFAMTENKFCMLLCDGSSWYVMNSNL